MKEKLIQLLYSVLKEMIDCIEESLDSIIFVKGKQMLYVLEVTILFLALSVLCEVFDKPCFTSWQEALTAVILTSILYLVNIISKTQIDALLTLIKCKEEEDSDNGK